MKYYGYVNGQQAAPKKILPSLYASMLHERIQRANQKLNKINSEIASRQKG